MSKFVAFLPALAMLALSPKPAKAVEPSLQLTDIALYMMQDLCPNFYYKKISPSDYALSGRPLYLRDPLDPNEEKGNWLTADAFRNDMTVFVSLKKRERRMDYFGEHYKATLRYVRLLLKRDGYTFKVSRDDSIARIEQYSINTKKNWPISVVVLENKSRSGLAIVSSY